MTNTDYTILVAWAKANHSLSASDVQCALALAFGGNYDIATISVQDAQEACASYASFADDVAGVEESGDASKTNR